MTVDGMAAVAILSCQPSSHPFNERQIALHEPVKVGRSVARARPAPNNAIFDCKVLSRNHAMIWYEGGKFYLQDTKSSNGTFVNHQRLSKGSEESPPREVFSSDIIQFGVDVMENSRRVTHGCVIATITLYHADGTEAKPNYAPNAMAGSGGVTLNAHSQELYQLAQYLQEALHREQMLESKLATLQRLVENTQEASESGWQALIDEDRLLSRLEVLEAQLQAYAKNQTEEKLREEMVALQEDKYNYETTAKESLRRILEEKLEAVRKLTDVEQSLSNYEDECTHLKEMCNLTQKQLESLAETHQEKLHELEDLQQKLQEAEDQHEKDIEDVNGEKMDIQVKLDAMVTQETELTEQVNSLQNDATEKSQQLDAMKVHLEEMELNSDNRIIHKTSQEVQVDGMIEKGAADSEGEEALRKRLRETQEQIETYRLRIKELESRLVESQSKVEHLQSDLAKAELEARSYIAKINSIEEKLKFSDLHLAQMVENAVADLRSQLNVSKEQVDSNSDLSMKLRRQIEELECQLCEYERDSANVTIMSTSDDTNSNLVHDNTTNQTNRVEGILSISKQAHVDELEKLKDLLCEARDAQQKFESEVARFKGDLDEAHARTSHHIDENKAVKGQLADTLVSVKEKDEYITSLRDQLSKADVTIQDVKKQIILLRGQLAEAEQSSKHSKNEAEQLRVKVKELEDELEREKVALKDTAITQRYYTTEESTATTTLKSSEFSALRQECDDLRQRILRIESDMRMSRQENNQLTADYSRLQESYHDLEHLKQRLEVQHVDNLTDSQKEADQLKQLTDSEDQVSLLTQRVHVTTDEITTLQEELGEMGTEYSLLAEKTRQLSVCAMIPIIILIFAILLAFYQPLAAITATSTLD